MKKSKRSFSAKKSDIKLGLNPSAKKRRNPPLPGESAAAKAARETKHNSAVLHAVWRGQKGKAALMFDYEGGETVRVGWPDGYPDQFPEEVRPSVAAHAQLFGPKVSAPKRGAPAVGPAPKDIAGKCITVLATSNPKKAGSASAKRFDLYKDGMTVEVALSKGLTKADIKWDAQHGFIQLG